MNLQLVNLGFTIEHFHCMFPWLMITIANPSSFRMEFLYQCRRDFYDGLISMRLWLRLE